MATSSISTSALIYKPLNECVSQTSEEKGCDPFTSYGYISVLEFEEIWRLDPTICFYQEHRVYVFYSYLNETWENLDQVMFSSTNYTDERHITAFQDEVKLWQSTVVKTLNAERSVFHSTVFKKVAPKKDLWSRVLNLPQSKYLDVTSLDVRGLRVASGTELGISRFLNMASNMTTDVRKRYLDSWKENNSKNEGVRLSL